MKNRRVFVSGGAGVIGTALVEQLLTEGAIVFVGDLKPCPAAWSNKVHYRMGDLTTIDPQELIDFAPEIYFHLAATFERSTESQPFFNENYHHNVLLSHYLLACLQQCPTLRKVIFASSYLIYDPKSYLFPTAQMTPTTLVEEGTIYPRNICGAAKLFHELELRFSEQFQKDVQFVSARIFRVYGYGSRDIISRWIRQALAKETLTVYSPEGLFDYIFANDAAAGLLKLSQLEYSGIVNLGSGCARKVFEVLEILKQHFPDLKTQISKPPEGPELFEASQAGMQHFQQLTQWIPPNALEDAIPKIIQFEKQNVATSHSPPQAILITSISKKVPLILAVKEAARKIGCFHIIHGSDTNENCIAKYMVDKFWLSPPSSHLSCEQLYDYCRQHNITAIIPTRDAELPFFAKHKAWFAEKGIHVMIANAKIVELCLDKKEFADALIKLNFPAIPTYLSADEIQSLYYAVKERKGAGSLAIGLKMPKLAAIEYASHLNEPIFQPYLEGREYTIDLYRDRSGAVKGCVARERNLIIQGESQVTTTKRKPVLEELCSQVANALDLYGHATFQAIESAEEVYHLIECNARFGGASTASVAAGLDTFYWFLLECCRESLTKYPFHRKPGELRQIRYPADTVIPW
jgi:carbamoyl-phosphate synthase large subunit